MVDYRERSMLDDILTAARPLVLITGTAGTGKTTLLAQLSDRLLGQGGRVTTLRCTAQGDLLPIRFAPGEHAARLPAPDRAGPTLCPVPGAADDRDLARRVAVTIAGSLPRDGLLLIDDAHWLDPDALAVLEALIRGRTRCVCAALPVPRAAAALRELRAGDLVDEFRLAPQPRRTVAREVTRILAATPEPALTERVRELSRGLPGALRNTVEALRRNGSIQVTDRNAYLARPQALLAPSADNQLVEAIRELGDDCWAIAKAMTVLAPLGPAAPALLAQILRMSEVDVHESLDLLHEVGVLHYGRSWRFVVPLVEAALFTCLGPFERGQLSAALVTAVWSNTAVCADEDYLADRIADAGALVDSDRALRELLHRAGTAQYDRPETALRWLVAATDLAQDDCQRAKVQLMHTVTCFAIGDHSQGLSGAHRVLADYADWLPPEALQELQAMATTALGAVGDHDALRELGSGQRRWTGGIEQSTVTRALAQCQLGRWHEASKLLRETESRWRAGNQVTVMLGELTWALAELWTGDHARFERRLANRGDWPLRSVRRHRRDQVAAHVTALLVTSDSHRATQLLAAEEISADDLPLDCRSMLAAARGEAEQALTLARRSIADAGKRGHETGLAAMYASTVSVLVARGEVATAQQVLGIARATPHGLGHLLDIAAAQLDRAFGDEAGARTRLLRCIADSDLTVGMDVACSELVDLALARGDRAEAERGLAELERLPRTSRTTMLTLLARATVQNDHAAARECERLVRERSQPLEQAIVLERLVEHGGAQRRLLAEAYELLGTLDALLYRAWSRNLMREHDVPVPGRKETVTENERLLAVLAAGGLSNRQLGATLRTSDKSVEGRLSRLFLRTGYRSRIELSTAMRNGEYRSAS